MRVLLISTYELGRQPVHLATPAAALRAAGHEVEALDLAVEVFDPERVRRAGAVAISVPMHTAMRLAATVAARVREVAPDVPVALYGLYAGVESDGFGVVHRLPGEYLAGLVAWADGMAGRDAAGERRGVPLPLREVLPPLDRYARLESGADRVVVGAVETTRGCRHLCRHCPIPAVYRGRVRVVEPEAVLADIDRLVSAGAGHITFGDPDFLNAPAHARRVVAGMRRAHPDITYDVTVKVEHILRHRRLWPELAPGLRFVVSAFETTSDRILGLLDKGHTAADMADAVHLLRSHGVEIRPSWLPFTPWTTPDDPADIVDFIVRHDLTGNVDPVQFSIRLLIPTGSLLLDLPELRPHLGDYDPEGLTWTWRAEHPDMDELQVRLASVAAAAADGGEEPAVTFARMADVIGGVAGRDLVAAQIPAGATAGRPRLTEPWFC